PSDSPAGANPRPVGAASEADPQSRPRARPTAAPRRRRPSRRSPRRCSAGAAGPGRRGTGPRRRSRCRPPPPRLAALAADPVEYLQRDLPLAQPTPLGLGHASLVEPGRLAEPGVGQVQPHVQWVVALRADVVDADGALAVGLLAQGAAVLSLDADGVLALL